MNLAVEYMMRKIAPEQEILHPRSLFATNVFDPTLHVAITIQNCYGKPDNLLVKHWNFSKLSQDKVLPPVEEYIICRKNIVTSPFVILEDFDIIPYQEKPSANYQKQHADEPYASTQTHEYEACMSRFFNTTQNEFVRKEWLWQRFINAFFPKASEGEFGHLNSQAQQSTIRCNFGIAWKSWMLWSSQMLCERPVANVASELIFTTAYRDKILNNPRYQEALLKIKKKEQEKKSQKTKMTNQNEFFIMNWDVVSTHASFPQSVNAATYTTTFS
jgi:hypothetical protein